MSDLSMSEVAAVNFQAILGVTDNFKTNEQMIQQAIDWAPCERMCAVILEQDADQLAAMLNSDEAADCFVDFTHNLAELIEYHESALAAFNACRARVLVAVARYAERMTN